MIAYKFFIAVPLLLMYLVFYFAPRPYSFRKRSTRKKLFIAVPLLLIYLVLYFVPCSYSIRVVEVVLLSEMLFLFYLVLRMGILGKFLLGVLGGVLIALFVLLAPWSYSIFVGEDEIRNTVEEIVAGESDPELKVIWILNWEKQNMTDMQNKSKFIFDFPFIWIRNSNDPSWIFFYKRGRCEEYTVLFIKMAEFADIQSRHVHNPAEDHAWAEVWIDNSWKHVDPSNNLFDDPGVYENGWGKQLSYVYTIDNEGKIHDITSRYTGTGRLIIHVVNDNGPVVGAEVIVKSKFLMENDPDYDKPRKIVPSFRRIFLTDENGECIFNLGGNNYTIAAELGGYRAENENVGLNEGDITHVTLSFF